MWTYWRKHLRAKVSYVYCTSTLWVYFGERSRPRPTTTYSLNFLLAFPQQQVRYSYVKQRGINTIPIHSTVQYRVNDLSLEHRRSTEVLQLSPMVSHLRDEHVRNTCNTSTNKCNTFSKLHWQAIITLLIRSARFMLSMVFSHKEFSFLTKVLKWKC